MCLSSGSLTACRSVPADYSSGFGGKYGVQADRVDKSAVGFDYQGKTEKHESQRGQSSPRGSHAHPWVPLPVTSLIHTSTPRNFSRGTDRVISHLHLI